MACLKLLTWNIEWATRTSKRGEIIRQEIKNLNPDIICLTEGFENILPENGFTITSEPNYGYQDTGSKRKVLLWSKNQWERIDQLGSKLMPSGRFISGVTNGIRIIGVCIPWKDAHVSTGMKNKQPWEDHIQYIKELGQIMGSYKKSKNDLILTGDFNQTIPRKRQNQTAFDLLQSLLDRDFQLLTKDILDDEGKLLIDHVAINSHQQGSIEKIISRRSEDGVRLSDHVGILASLF